MSVLARFRAFATKALSIITGSDGFIPISLVRSSITSVETNRALWANVVMAPVFWILRNFTEAELVIQRRIGDDNLWDRVPDHPIELLIAGPNDTYGGDELWKATALSYTMDGNAYWWKVRNVFGEVIQLWYIPHWMIRPISPPDGMGTSSSRVISAYQVSMGLQGPVYLDPRNVVHFRFGLDPEDTRMGISPLKSVMREIAADMQAAEFSETVLGNMGIPGLIISPKDSTVTITPEQVVELRNYLKSAATGNNSGSNLAFGKPVDIVQLGWDPNKIQLPSLRDISEERICAILGIPAAVVGFGAGLQSTKVGATMRELVKLAQVSCLIPMQKTMARQVTAQLMPDFISQTRRFRARFDMSEASSFQEEYNLRVDSTTKLVAAGLLRVDRAQHELGLEVDDTQQVYLRPTTSVAVDENGDPIMPAPTVAAPPGDSTNGNGNTNGNTNGNGTDAATQKMLRGMVDQLPARLTRGLPSGR